MKKSLIVLSYVAVFLLGGFFFGSNLTTGDASNGTKQITVTQVPLKFYVNNVRQAEDPNYQAFLYKNTTYVPIRFVSQSLDKNVFWEQATRSIYINDKVKPQPPVKEEEKKEEKPKRNNDNNIVYLSENKVLANGENTLDFNQKVTTNTGKVYYDSANIYRANSDNNYFDRFRGHMEFWTNERYDKFIVQLAPGAYWRGDDSSEYVGELRVYVDDRYEGSKSVYANDEKPVELEVDISEGKKVRIEYEGNHMNIIEPRFIRDSKE